MIDVTTFDELNRLVGYNRSMPISTYFDEMPITTEQKRLRKAFANRLEDEMVWLMSFLFYTRDNPQYTVALQEIRERYMELARQELSVEQRYYVSDAYYGDNVGITRTYDSARYQPPVQLPNRPQAVPDFPSEIDLYIIDRVNQATADIVAATDRHKDDPYYYSKDRARVIAENESNTVHSHKEYSEVSGKKSLKQWLTIMDGHERESHAEVNGTILPINEPFVLQGGLMLYPRDASTYGVSEDEIVGCRCGIRYF